MMAAPVAPASRQLPSSGDTIWRVCHVFEPLLIELSMFHAVRRLAGPG